MNSKYSSLTTVQNFHIINDHASKREQEQSNQTKPKIISQTCLRCYVLETWENPMFNLQNNSSIFVKKKQKNWEFTK